MGTLFEYVDTCQCIYFLRGGRGALKLNSDQNKKWAPESCPKPDIHMCIVYVGTTFKYRH